MDPRRERDFYLKLFDEFPTPIWRSGPDAACDYFNKSWLAFTGRTLDKELGDGWAEGVHPDDLSRCLETYLTAFRARVPFQMEYRLRRHDGEYRTIVDYGRPFDDIEGHFAGYIGSCYDVTDRERLEEGLRQAQKLEAVGQLASGVAHDFNNLLTVILGNAQLLLRKRSPETPDFRRLDMIKKAAEQASGLTRQLLAFGRKQLQAPTLLDLNLLVGGMEQLVGSVVGERIALVIRPDRAPAWIHADPDQIQQAILNLASNAKEAMPAGGQLTISTVCDGSAKTVALEISDTGCGMDEQTRSHLFEPFFTTKQLGQGTGLGLSTVYGVVKQSGGRIDVTSAPGRGTTFTISLPLAEPPSAPRREPERASAPAGGARAVLLAEDDDMVRDIIRETLEGLGCHVLNAGDGRDALRLFRLHRDPIHLVITDIMLPGMTGWELVEAVWASRPQTPVLLISGYAKDIALQTARLESGPWGFLQKPFTIEAFTSKVDEMLESSQDTGGGH